MPTLAAGWVTLQRGDDLTGELHGDEVAVLVGLAVDVEGDKLDHLRHMHGHTVERPTWRGVQILTT